jgi:hypothetical protein
MTAKMMLACVGEDLSVPNHFQRFSPLKEKFMGLRCCFLVDQLNLHVQPFALLGLWVGVDSV